MGMDLIKENIEYEQLLGENSIDTVVTEEYIIPDTHPDLKEILMIDAKVSITSKEIMQDKVYLEGQVVFNVLYLGKGEEHSELYNVVYASKFSNYIEIQGAYYKMICDAQCYLEHISSSIVNERKISIEGIIKLISKVYSENKFEMIKDVSVTSDVQLLREPRVIDKVIGIIPMELASKSHIVVSMDKPQVGNILKCDINIHKKQTKVFQGKVQIEAFANIKILYKDKDTRDINYLEDDILITKDYEDERVNSSMDSFTDFKLENSEFYIKEDDLGEARIIDVEVLIKAVTKIISKEDIETIEDAYSPKFVMKLEKQEHKMNIIYGSATNDVIIKENLEYPSNKSIPLQVIMSSGNTSITDKKILDGKVSIDGVIEVNIIYKTSDEDRYIGNISEEIPFNCMLEIPGCRIDMLCDAKASLETIEAGIEANTIAVKCVVSTYAGVTYLTHKEFVINLLSEEGEVLNKKASVTIYSVQPSDSLWKIAKKYGTTVETLVKINEIENLDNIKFGQKLIIPGRAIL